MSADGWADLCVVLARVAHIVELLVRSENTAAEPDCVPLDHILGDIAIHCCRSARDLVVGCHSLVETSLQLCFQSIIEASKQRASTRQHNVLVKLDSVMNRAALDRIVNDFSQRLGPVLANKFLKRETTVKKDWLVKCHLLDGRTFLDRGSVRIRHLCSPCFH